jgi:cytochrome c553
MKLASVAVLGFGLVMAAPAFAGPTEGQGLYEVRCKMCHANGVNNAPPIEKIQADITDPAAIVEKLTNGTMMAMASGLSDQDKADIAAFLTTKTPSASGDASAATPAVSAPAAEPATPAAPAPQ